MYRSLGDKIIKETEPPDLVLDRPADRYYDSSGGLILTLGGGDQTVLSQSDSITYTRTPKGQPLRYNLCVHNRFLKRYDVLELEPQHVHNLSTGGFTEYSTGHLHAQTAHSVAEAAAIGTIGFSPYGHTWLRSNGQSLMNHLAELVQPDLTQLSVPNFILELDDLRQVYRLAKRLRERGFKQTRKRQTKFDRERFIKKAGKKVAGGNLAYQFGVKPTLGDIKNMAETVISLRSKLAEFNSRVNTVVQRSRILLEDETSVSGTFNYQGDSHQPCEWRASVERTCVGLIRFKYKPIPKMGRTEETLRLFLDGLGFELNPRIIWEAIPFSFVVDWFTNVGTALESLKIDTLEIPVEYVDSCLQYSERLRIESRLRLDVGSSVSSETQWPGWSTQTIYFERLPICPRESVFTGLGWDLPNLNQAGLLLSLGLVLGYKS